MKQFFKTVFASMVGTFFSILLIFFLLFIVILGSIASLSDDEKVNVKSHSILHIQLNERITERTEENPFGNFNPFNAEMNSPLGLNSILSSIKNASTDANIDGIYLDISSIDAGLSTTEEIRNALIDFKKTGKFVYSYSEYYTQKAYYLASVSDSIFLNPSGLLELSGLNAQYMFFQKALEKLEIEAQVIRVGSFKSAVEPYISDHMSDSNKVQTNTYLTALFNHMVMNIATSRKMSVDSIYSIATHLYVRNANDAVLYGLADRLLYKDELLSKLMKKTSQNNLKDLELISLKKYAKSANPKVNVSKEKIAIIYANGQIGGGEGNSEDIGSEGLSKTIRAARLDNNIKAVVLRVNSPGGGSLASDIIWREVFLTKQVKPIIVSMGDVAASGGYLIACAADTIVAQPTTITGSIGVFGVIPNFKGLLNNKLGITFDGVKIGEYADLGDLSRALTPAERLIIQNEVNRIYEDFTAKVAAGRKIPVEAVKRIAEGRVWSGIDAKRIGLVDVLGDIDDAINIAAKKAKVSDYRIVHLPELTDPFEKFMKQLNNEVALRMMPEEYRIMAPYAKELSNLKNTFGIQSRLPYTFQIN